MHSVIVLGSARSGGNTHQLADAFAQTLNSDLIDLNALNFSGFDYTFANRNDDFLPLIRRILRYDRIVLASPVYWYAPSAPMKKFIDRLSDLLKSEKALGRTLRSKKAVLLATGSDELPAGCFEEAFRRTFEYLGMHYEGMLYAQCDNDFELAAHNTRIAHFFGALQIG